MLSVCMGQEKARSVFEAAEIEQGIFNLNNEMVQCLERCEVRRHYRPHRIIPQYLQVDIDAQKNLMTMKAELPKGSYMSVLVAQLVQYR